MFYRYQRLEIGNKIKPLFGSSIPANCVKCRWKSQVPSIGILREVKGKWERRSPLSPNDVKKLSELTTVFVQSSNRRIFSDEEYRQAGAKIVDDISSADLLFGVKEVPIKYLIDGKTYMYFSHTHKGQSHNMPMLDAILKQNIRLMDYELLTNDSGMRTVAFGKFAGYAGMINMLHGVGLQMLHLGYSSPFLNVGRSYSYYSLEDASESIRKAGHRIHKYGLPKEFGPFVFTFTGDGKVSQGAQEVFRNLPHQYVEPDELPRLMKDFDNKKLYATVAKPANYTVRLDGGQFEMMDFIKHGSQKYKSVFCERFLPYTTVLVNGVYWEPKYPRLVHRTDLSTSAKKLLAIADISCDIQGSLEFTERASTIDDPFFYIDQSGKEHTQYKTGSFIMSTVDNLPAELPYEASMYFSKSLLPYAVGMIKQEQNVALERATIASDGKLRNPFAHLVQSIVTSRSATSKKRVLLLGSGRVAAPLVDYFLKKANVNITIASNALEEAQRLSRNHERASCVPLDVANEKSLGDLIREHDIVVSFVPAQFHPVVAKLAVENGRNMVTASYVSPQLQSFHDAAKSKGIIILNELGLDPGIDHLLAMRFFDQVKSRKGEITSFTSWCGGLPSPEASNNPFGYKFSWSPRGVLIAATNPALYKLNGEIVELAPGTILEHAVPVEIFKGFNFEGLPNRDSLKYIKLYGLNEDKLKTMFRGTLRYKGFSEALLSLKMLGLLDLTTLPDTVSTWNDLLSHTLSCSKKDLKQSLKKALSQPQFNVQQALQTIDWLKLQSDNPISKPSTALDELSKILEKRLKFDHHERDMICLHHVFGAEVAGKQEVHTSTLVAYGDGPDGYSAMAKTVSLPAAIGADLILQGKIKARGVTIPLSSDIYEPILHQLEKEGLHFVEKQEL